MNSTTLLLIASICVVIAESKKESWDYFVFVEQWPQSLCVKERRNGKKCEIPRNNADWTIHGLWPSSSQGPTPFHCNDQRFDMNQIKELIPKMNTYWTDFHPTKSLWGHEWYVHGTCATSLNATSTQKRYFEKGLSLRMKYELKPILEKCKVVPSDTSTYYAPDVQECLEKNLVKKLSLFCFKAAEGKLLLSEIRLCVSKTFQLLDCPEDHDATSQNKKGLYLQPCEDRNVFYPIIKYNETMIVQ